MLMGMFRQFNDASYCQDEIRNEIRNIILIDVVTWSKDKETKNQVQRLNKYTLI